MENMQNDSETISLKKIIIDYLFHWKVFFVAACVSLVCAILYLVFYPKTYEFIARIKIQEDKNLGSGGSLGLGEAAGLMKSFGLGGVSGGAVNIDDEIAIISSNDLLKKVVVRLGLNVTYKEKYSLISLYEDSPLLIVPDSLTQEKLDSFVSFDIKISENGTAQIKMGNTGEEYSFVSLPAQLRVSEGVFDIFYRTESGVKRNIKKPFSMNISISPAGWTAEDLAEAITVDEFSKNANTLELLYSDYSKKRGKDLLNALMEEYNKSSESVKKEEGHKAMAFLDVRINGVLQELNNIELTIESYKIKNKLTDLKYDVQYYADAVKSIREKIIEFEAQSHIINLLEAYVKDPKNKYSVIPAMLSADGEKGGAISAYNDALMGRDKINKSTNSINPLSEIADSQIDKLRDGVVSAIDNAQKSSQFVLNDLKSQEKAIMEKMEYVPTYEREYLDYKREQEILQGVYLILLQKREEVALSLGQERDRGFIVDAAVAKYRPVAPRKLFAVLGFLIFTIIIPIGYLFAKQQLQDLMDIYKGK